ncbi:MAG TPA: type II secretion system F family protein [Candidatus Limnocylindria bacterium]|nr:type II secretion system F family protein [Candidatus Limnocylindria bacterium]
MTVLGAILAGVCVAAAVLASHRDSSVARWLRVLDAVPRHTAIPGVDDDLAARVAVALAGGLAGSVIALIGSLGPLPLAVGAYAGWVAPSIAADRRAARRRRAAERSVVTLVEWLHALVSCGRPADAALARLADHDVMDGALRRSLARVRRDYVLGVPMRDALAREAAAAGVGGLDDLAATLERARDLGRGALPLLQDLRDDLRARERARILATAAAVEGRLTAVMTLCYLPALALLVLVPLFLTLLAGLFGS